MGRSVLTVKEAMKFQQVAMALVDLLPVIQRVITKSAGALPGQ